MDNKPLLDTALEVISKCESDLADLDSRFNDVMEDLEERWSEVSPEEMERWDSIDLMVHHLKVRSSILRYRLEELVKWYK